MNFADFMASVADQPRTVSDVPLEGAQPIPGQVIPPGMPPGFDPNKPWRSIDVDGYVGAAKWGVRQTTKMIAALCKEPLMALDKDDMDACESAVTEATQRCLYDLRLSGLADHPYVKLPLAVGALMTVKYMAAKLAREQLWEEVEERRRAANGHPNNARQRDSSPSEGFKREGRSGGPNPRPSPPTAPPPPQSQYDPPPPPMTQGPQNPQTTVPDLWRGNGRMAASGDVSSFAGFRIQESPSSSSSGFAIAEE